jgi:hypothetical protein
VTVDELPLLDEHRTTVAAPAAVVWSAALATFRRSFESPLGRTTARLVGCHPARSAGWDDPAVGTSIPGFAISEFDPPHRLVLAGRHRFSRYAIVLTVEPLEQGCRVRLESRAAFPGPAGAAYRAAVIGTRGHRVAVRRLLRDVRRRAEQVRT